MFTVEMDADGGRAVCITTLDQSGDSDDVEVLMYDDEVYVIQHDDDEHVHMVIMSAQQWLDIISAMNLTEGAYYLAPTRQRRPL